MRYVALGLLVVGPAIALASALQLGRLERGGPYHVDLELAGGVPATFYLPGEPDEPDPRLMSPPPPDARPPAVVLLHGFSADRVMMSTLARRLAANGYAVLAPDLHGHGANRSPFPSGVGRSDAHFDDIAAAVSFLRSSPYVDGSRLVVMGHSMGAGAALDFASRDSALDGVVAISGSRMPTGPFSPPNVLVLWAEKDSADLRASAAELARRIAGGAALALGATHGDLAQGRGVRAVEIPGADHLTVIFSAAATREILAWLDAIFGTPRRAALALEEPRLPVLGVALVGLLLSLPGVGWIAGRFARALPERPTRGALQGLAGLALALGCALPFLAVGMPIGFVPLEAGDAIGSLLFAAGALALAVLAARGRLAAGTASIGSGIASELRAALAPGLAAFACVYLLSLPIGVVGHRLVPTPERAAIVALLFALVLPYFVAQEVLVRRGGPLAAGILGLAARALLVLALVVGVRAGMVPRAVGIMIPLFVALSLAIELAATAIYATSRNLLVVAVLESAWIAWVIAALMPTRA